MATSRRKRKTLQCMRAMRLSFDQKYLVWNEGADSLTVVLSTVQANFIVAKGFRVRIKSINHHAPLNLQSVSHVLRLTRQFRLTNRHCLLTENHLLTKQVVHLIISNVAKACDSSSSEIFSFFKCHFLLLNCLTQSTCLTVNDDGQF